MPKDEQEQYFIGNHEYQIILKYTEMDQQLYLINVDNDHKELIIEIGMKHIIFQNNEELLKAPMFENFVKFIKCLAISEVKSF